MDQSAEMDQSSVMDQSEPLDLSTSKESKVDSKQQLDASKDSMENSSMKKETVPVSAPTGPWPTGPVPDISKSQSPIARRSSPTTVVINPVTTTSPSTSQPGPSRLNKTNNEPIRKDNSINQSDSINTSRSAKCTSPVSTPTRKIISKRNLSNTECSTVEKSSDTSLLKRRRLSDEFKNDQDFGLEAEKSSLEVVKRLSR